jgi:hypothetical protein
MNRKKIYKRLGLAVAGLLLLFTFVTAAQPAYAVPAPPPGNPTCEATGFSLNWILCPIFNGVSNMIEGLINNFIVPFLKVPPVSTDPKSASFQSWSNFRIYGDIFLVIAIIVIVFGQAIGGGVIDAYTAKKTLPRILVAAILINLSIYIVGFLVDIFNVLGNGVSNIMLAPFGSTLNFSPSPGQQLGIFGFGFLGFILAGGGFIALVVAMFASFSTVIMAAFFAVLPFLLALLAIFITLVFRQGLILFLVMVSPIAFALYTLPNTQNLFKKWWDLMIEALLVYPIVLIIFTLSDILSATVLEANGFTKDNFAGNLTSASNKLAALIAFFMLVAPLFLIPFAFRLAGGTLSRAHALADNGRQKAHQWSQSRGDFAKTKFRRLYQDKQIQNYQQAKGHANESTGVKKWAYRQMYRRAAGANPDLMEARLNAEVLKEQEETSATGRDPNRRGLLVDLSKSDEQLAAEEKLRYVDGKKPGTKIKQYLNAGNQWVDEEDVKEAHRVGGHSTAAMQASLTYDLGKATNDGQMESIMKNFGSIAHSHGLTADQINSASIGANFAMQGKYIPGKSLRYNNETGEMAIMDGGEATMEDQAARSASFMSNQDRYTFDTDSAIVKRALETIDTREKAADLHEPLEGATPEEKEHYRLQRATLDKQNQKELAILRNAVKVADVLRPMSYPTGGATGRPSIAMVPEVGGEPGAELTPGIATGGGILSYSSAKTKEAAESFIRVTDAARSQLARENRGVNTINPPPAPGTIKLHPDGTEKKPKDIEKEQLADREDIHGQIPLDPAA